MRQTQRRVLALALAVYLGMGGPAVAAWWEEPTAASAVREGGRKTTPSGKPNEAWQIDWPGGSVQVMAGATADMREMVNAAHARSIALKTARHLAYERLAETVKGVRIDADSTYDRELMLDSNLRTRVSALIQGARVVEERVTEADDGSIWAEVVLELSFHGEGQALAGPTSEWALEKGKITRRSFEWSSPLAQSTAKVKTPPTGVLIDASGLGGEPAMLPRVLGPDGRTVYSAGDVPSDFLVRHGLVGYAASVTEARESERVGPNPLVVRALRMEGTDVVVSQADAERLLAANDVGHVLDKCRVTVVLGEEGEGQ